MFIPTRLAWSAGARASYDSQKIWKLLHWYDSEWRIGVAAACPARVALGMACSTNGTFQEPRTRSDLVHKGSSMQFAPGDLVNGPDDLSRQLLKYGRWRACVSLCFTWPGGGIPPNFPLQPASAQNYDGSLV